jgi:hypothetical protein
MVMTLSISPDAEAELPAGSSPAAGFSCRNQLMTKMRLEQSGPDARAIFPSRR